MVHPAAMALAENGRAHVNGPGLFGRTEKTTTRPGTKRNRALNSACVVFPPSKVRRTFL
ncbi:MAG: hypothetical protein H6696_20150 [Deferribacteres bacterium]|nr:hypothetical protein [Deferribacteres bacterium]